MAKPSDQLVHQVTKQREARLIVLSSGERAAIAASKAAAARGEFASDEEVRTIWAKHGLT